MVFFPLSVLALAAGVYLLIKVKREYLGGAFELLAWLVIFLSLVAIGFGGYKAVKHSRGKCDKRSHCNIEKKVLIKDGGKCHQMNAGACAHNGSCRMEGDSVIMDEATCAGIMGKEACAAMRQQRGRCIVSKDECAKMCATSGKQCCMKGEGAAACSNAGSKECCKKHD